MVLRYKRENQQLNLDFCCSNGNPQKSTFLRIAIWATDVQMGQREIEKYRI